MARLLTLLENITFPKMAIIKTIFSIKVIVFRIIAVIQVVLFSINLAIWSVGVLDFFIEEIPNYVTSAFAEFNTYNKPSLILYLLTMFASTVHIQILFLLNIWECLQTILKWSITILSLNLVILLPRQQGTLIKLLVKEVLTKEPFVIR